MTNLLRLAALLAPDAGDGGGGSLLTQNAGKGEGEGGGKADVQTSGKDGDGKAAAGTEPTAEQKAADAAKAALEAAVDDKWSPKLADGQKLDDAALKEFRELAKKGGFKAGQAQSLVEFQIAREAAADKAATEGFAKQRESWRESLKKDPQFGGANYEKSLRNVQRVMTKYGASETFKKFADAGAGDHPDFVKFVAAIGADLAEDPGVKPGAKPNAASAEDAELRKMFDKSPELFTA